MRVFLAIVFRCVLALGLGFTPVANALEMAAMLAPQEDIPPCHAPSQDQHHADSKCCGTAHCHCAMANALPMATVPAVRPVMASDHPLTVHQLALDNTLPPDTPPPRA